MSKLRVLIILAATIGLTVTSAWTQTRPGPKATPAAKTGAKPAGKPDAKPAGRAGGNPAGKASERTAGKAGGNPAAMEAPRPQGGRVKKPGKKDITQVQLQLFISEMSEHGMRSLGANLSYTRTVRGEEQSGSLQEVVTNVFSPKRDFEAVTLPVPLAGRGLRPKENLVGFGLTGSVLNAGYGTIDFMFRGLERKSDVDLVSKPELLVVNEEQASLSAGGRIPYQAVSVKGGKETLSVDWKQVGVNMKLTPKVLPNNMIYLQITELNVKELSRFDKVRGLDLPVFAERSQTGNVLVPNGQTLVIGGLTSEVIRKTERRVPLLGKLPVLGMAFRSRKSEADFTTLMIFVSPTIVNVRNLSRNAKSALAFWQEKETVWANQERIDQEFSEMKKSSSLW